MPRRGQPAFYIATRGVCYFHLRIRTGGRDLHSGTFGGVALNASHALVQTLSGVLARDGRLPEPLRKGVVPPTDEELADWASQQPGAEVLAEQGARPADPAAADELYLRTWAEPSVDVNGVESGSPQLQKTVIPVVAEANLSLRLAPGQRGHAVLVRAPRAQPRRRPEPGRHCAAEPGGQPLRQAPRLDRGRSQVGGLAEAAAVPPAMLRQPS